MRYKRRIRVSSLVLEPGRKIEKKNKKRENLEENEK